MGPRIYLNRFQYLLNDIQLVDFRLSGKEGLTISEFSQYASYRPEINSLSVIIQSQQQFRGSVPPGGHIISEIASLLGKHASKTEITQFEHPTVTDQKIFRLYVSMNYVHGVAVSYALHQLVDKLPYGFRLHLQ